MSAIFVSHSSRDNAAAGKLRERLAEQGHHSIFVDFDPEDGIPAGRDWERELYRQLRACQAMIALVSEHSASSRWCFAEITHAKSLGKPVFPVKIEPCEVDSVLSSRQAIDLTREPEEGYRRLWRGLAAAGLDPKDSFGWDADRSPYPGLLAFGERDAAVFFGRGPQIQQGLDTLRRLRQFGGVRALMILGASGSGKSSLLRAGIVPRLRRDDDWLVVGPFRPREDPHRELAVALTSAFAAHGETRDWKELRQQLAEGEDAAGRILAGWAVELQIAAGRRDATVLLAIDQVEELLSAEDGSAAARFVATVREGVEDDGGALMTVGTLRSDFLGQLQQQPALRDFAFEDLLVGRLSPDQLVEVVEGPARLAGIELEPGLTAALLAEAEGEDALPLLAFTLRELYELGADDGLLEIREYREELGGLSAGVARVADAVLASVNLSEDQMRHLRSAFLAMARVDEGGRFVRRPARWSDFLAGIRATLERFVDARLLSSQERENERVVEVSHEALFRSWDRLKEWLNQSRELLLWRQRLGQAMGEWLRTQGDPSALLRGPSLAEARGWQQRKGEVLSVAENDFVNRSSRAATRRRWTWVGTAVAVMAALATLAAFSLHQARLADSRLDIAIEQVSEIDSTIDRELRKLAGAEPARVQLQATTKRLLSELLAEEERHLDARFQLALNHQRAGEVAAVQNDLATAEAEVTAAREILEQGLERLAATDDRWTRWQSELSEVEHDLGRIASLRKQPKAVREWHERGLARAERLASAEAPEPRHLHALARSQQQLGRLAAEEGDSARARAFFDQAVANLLAATAAEPDENEWQADLSRAYSDLAGIEDAPERSRDWLLEGLRVARELVRDEPGNALWQEELGLVYWQLGHYARMSAILSTDTMPGRVDEAETWWRQSLDIRQLLAQCGPSSSRWQIELGSSYGSLGSLAELRQDPASARVWYEKELAVYRRQVETEPENQLVFDLYVQTQGKLAGVLAAAGDLPQARALYAEVLEVLEEQALVQPENPKAQEAAHLHHYLRGFLEQDAGEPAEAEIWFAKAAADLRRLIALRPEALQHRGSLVGQLIDLGGLAKARGDAETARRRFEESIEQAEELYARSPSVDHAATLQRACYFLVDLLGPGDEASQRYYQRMLEVDQVTGLISGTGPAGGASDRP